jgi:alpha-1,2-mannosyltransferase
VALLAVGNTPLLLLVPSTDMPRMHVDFETFRASAVALLHGRDIYDAGAVLHNLNPPVLAALFAPLGLLDPVVGYRILVGITALIAVGCVLATTRELGIGRWWGGLALLALLASSPLHGTILLGQIYGLLLLGVTAGWIAERRGHPRLAAVLYGVTVAVKPSLAPLLLLPAVQRRWPEFRTGLLAAAAATAVGLVAAGPSSGWNWLRMVAAEPVATIPDNASLPGLAIRWGLPSVVGTVVGGLAVVGTLWWFWRRTRRFGVDAAHGTDPAGTAPWAVLAAGLLAAPISWHNYLILLWPGLLLVVASGRPGDARRAVVAALFALSVIPVSYADLWPAGNPVSAVALALYSAILTVTWLTLLRPAVGPSVAVAVPDSFRSAEVVARPPG